MSDTPRSDAEIYTAMEADVAISCVDADFARILERELSVAEFKARGYEVHLSALSEKISDLCTKNAAAARLQQLTEDNQFKALERCEKYETQIAELTAERDRFRSCPKHAETARELDPLCPICLLAEVNRLEAALRLAVHYMDVGGRACIPQAEREQIEAAAKRTEGA